MGGLRNAGSIGCWEGDHVSNGCWNSGGKRLTPSPCGPKACEWASLRVAAIEQRIAKWEVGSGERVKPRGAGISGRSGGGKGRLKKGV